MLAFPSATVCGGLTLPDPGRHRHRSPQDVQVPDIFLHSSVFTPWKEESCSSLGKMVFYKINKCAWGRSVAANELGWKSKIRSSGPERVKLAPRVALGWSWMCLKFESIFSSSWEKMGPEVDETSSSHGS